VQNQEKINVLTKALEFYGNKANWSEPYLRSGEMGAQALKPLHNDFGSIAREVLVNISIPKEEMEKVIVCHYCGFKLNFLIQRKLKFMINEHNNCFNCDATQHEWGEK